VLGGLVLALVIADIPLAGLAHQSLNAIGGSVPVWVSAPFALVGFCGGLAQAGQPAWLDHLGPGVFPHSQSGCQLLHGC
jgi:hypothetical protein